MRTLLVVAAAMAATATGPLHARAFEADPQELVRPSPLPPSVTRAPIPVPGGPRRTGDSADAGFLKGARAVDIRTGEARVALADGSPRTLRVGDVVGDDTLERIDSGRLIFQRRANPSGLGGGLVIVSFGADGRARVRVYRSMNNTSPTPEVR